MISCNAYEFNETTVQGYSNSMISGMWRAVTKTSLYLNATSQSVAFIFQTLLNERSVIGFGLNHPSEQSSSTLKARVSSDRELMEREHRIAPTLEGYLEGELEYKCVKSLTRGFACYSHMIAILCDIDIELLSIGRLKRSCKCQSDAMVRFIELEGMKECQMCLEHGIQGISRVGMLEHCNLRLFARD